MIILDQRLKGVLKMKKRKIYGLAIVILALSITLGSFFATSTKITSTDRKVTTSEAEKNLGDLQKIMQAESYTDALYFDNLDVYAQGFIEGAYSTETLMFLLNTGRMLGYLDDFKAAGIVSQDYQSPYTSGENTKATSVSQTTPEPVTTEKCTEKVMWATGTVNVRENGSTSYKKVGSLKAGEQVTVTGTDSTGWYEIRLQDGTVGHVSDKYLTEDDPSVSAAPKTDAETPQTEPTEETTEGAEPTEETAATPDVEEVEAVEEDADNSTEPAIEEPSAAPDPSATTVPEEDTEDLNTDPSPAADVQEEKTNDGLKTIILVSAVGLVVLGLGICTVTYLHRKKK